MFKKLWCFCFGHKYRPVIHFAALYKQCECGDCQLLANTDELAAKGIIEVDFQVMPFHIQRQLDKILSGVK